MAYALGEHSPAAGQTVVCQALAAYSMPFARLDAENLVATLPNMLGWSPAKICHSCRSKAVFSACQACMGSLGP